MTIPLTTPDVFQGLRRELALDAAGDTHLEMGREVVPVAVVADIVPTRKDVYLATAWWSQGAAVPAQYPRFLVSWPGTATRLDRIEVVGFRLRTTLAASVWIGWATPNPGGGASGVGTKRQSAAGAGAAGAQSMLNVDTSATVPVAAEYQESVYCQANVPVEHFFADPFVISAPQSATLLGLNFTINLVNVGWDFTVFVREYAARGI